MATMLSSNAYHQYKAIIMKPIYRHFALALLTATALSAQAQDLKSAYFLDSYLYQHELNPAYGNEENYFSIPVVGNFNVNMMGNFGYEEIVRENPLYPDRSNKKMTSFLNPYLKTPLTGFGSGDNCINTDVKVGIVSFGFKSKNGSGYNTVELNLRGTANVNIPYKLFQFAADAVNERYEIGDVAADAQTFAEIALGRSAQIDKKLRVGMKAKLLLGIGDASVRMKDVVADLKDANKWTISGDAQTDVSMSGFKYLSKTKDYNAKEGSYKKVNDVDLGLGLSGFGLAVDAGAIYKVNEDLTLSAAVNDLGAILWTSDERAANKSKSFEFNGFHDVSVDSQSDNVLDKQADKYTDQLFDFFNLTDEGDQGTRITGIGATVNVGAEYVIPTYRALKLGLLGTVRVNGPHSWTEGRLSANLKPANWIEAGLNVAVNNYTANIGWAAVLKSNTCNFFIGMDRVVGKVSKEFIPLNSNASLCFGLCFNM